MILLKNITAAALVCVSIVGAKIHADRFSQTYYYNVGPWGYERIINYDPINCILPIRVHCIYMLVLQNGFSPPFNLPPNPNTNNVPGFVSFQGDFNELTYYE